MYAWWIAAGVAVAAELLTGTFYLLMFALGLMAAAVLAAFDTERWHQFVVAALVGGGAVALWHWRRGSRPATPSPQVNRDLLLDIGQTVHVTHWRADGTARVHYRGAEWSARHESPTSQTPAVGHFVIRAVDGSQLVLGHPPSPPV